MRLLVAVTLVLLGFAAPAPAQTRSGAEGLDIISDAEWGTRTTSGYVPVRLDITNVGDARVIEIVGTGSRSSVARPRGVLTGNVALRQQVRLARGDRVRLTVNVPVYADRESVQLRIVENGRTIELLSYLAVASRQPEVAAAVLLVADPGTAFGKAAASWRRTGGRTIVTSLGSAPATTLPTPTRGTFQAVPPPAAAVPPAAFSHVLATRPGGSPVTDVILEPSRLPATWISYTSMRAVAIGPEEWKLLSQAQQSALLTWVACGGDLIFVDGDARTLLGNVATTTVAPAFEGIAAPAHAHLLGRIHAPTSEEIRAIGFDAVLEAVAKAKDPHFALPTAGAAWGTSAVSGFRLAIPGIRGVPANAYLGILVLFSILIGPLNYWWLRRKRQQVLVVLSAPVISAIFIVVLAGYAIAGQGFSVYGRAATFTALDEARQQSATRATATLYAAGLTPSAGLRFPQDVAVFPAGPEGYGAYGRMTLDLSDAQHFTSGVLQARAPTNLEVISARPARERLTISRAGGTVSVVNGFDATIQRLIYRDGDVPYQLTSPLEPGAKAELTVRVPDGRGIVPGDLPLADRFIHLISNQPEQTYIAILDRSPFFESGVDELVERGSFHLVLGWPEGQR